MSSSFRSKVRGVVDGRLADLPGSPNAVSSEEGTAARFKVDALSGTAEEMVAAIAATGGEVVTQTDDYIHATYTSALLRFVDDVELRRDPEMGESAWQVRSASRIGYSDMGANRKRVTAIRSALLTGVTG
ncbi:MAG: DUF1499 domain-containing protein [Litorimonas sp.]